MHHVCTKCMPLLLFFVSVHTVLSMAHWCPSLTSLLATRFGVRVLFRVEVWGLGLVSMRHACALTSQVLLPLYRDAENAVRESDHVP